MIVFHDKKGPFGFPRLSVSNSNKIFPRKDKIICKINSTETEKGNDDLKHGRIGGSSHPKK